MALIELNKKQFEEEIGKLDEEMKERIAMFGTPIDGINEQENKIQIEVFPNRPDLLSFHGFKRAFRAFLGKDTGLKEYKVNKPEENYKVIIDSSVKDIRPYTACSIVRGLKLDNEKIKEIIDIQEKLHLTMGRKRKKIAIGIYPLEKIKLPITFKALEPDKIKFLPLDSEKELSGLEILQKTAAGKEYAHLLAGKAKFPIFVDANDKILSMPPIINSNETGRVSEQTKDIFVECSGFDFAILNKCLNILVTCLADMGGKIYQMEIKSGTLSKKAITPNLTPEKMKLSLQNTEKLLGVEFKEKQIKECLEKMGHNYTKGEAIIPAWRTDILHEVDLIEDVAIGYGYENFIPEIPSISTIGEEDKKEIIKRKIAEILVGLGLLEVSNYHLTSKNTQFENMSVSEKQARDVVEVENSKTDFNILRKNISHYLLKNLSENIDVEYPQKIFEIGKIFSNEPKTDSVSEKESLAIALSPSNFTEIKQVVEYLFRSLGIKTVFSEPADALPHFISGRVAEIKLAGSNNVLGHFGEVHPKILKNWKIKMPIALMEIDLEPILNR
ncbi:MAG: phenylalanine--tRNA ligase subunit beta [Candidatus Pacearchaeota archaeon]